MPLTEPCRTCGSTDVTVAQVPEPARYGDAGPRHIDERKCRNPECPINNRTARYGDVV